MLAKAASLPTAEIRAYFLIWSGAVAYAIYELYKVIQDYPSYNNYYDLNDGWMVNRKKDIVDFEWESFRELLITLLPWLITYNSLSEALKTASPKSLPYFQFVSTILFLLYNTHTLLVLLLLVQTLLFWVCEKFKKVSLMWGCSCMLIVFTNFYNHLPLDNQFFHLNDFQLIYVLTSISWTNLRCISFCIDKIRGQHNATFFEYLAYCFYLPLLITGPFISYNDYKASQVKQDNVSARLQVLLKNVVRVFFWMYFKELGLHFFYVNTMMYHSNYVKSFNPWALYGYGFAMGQFFHIKYVVFYGFSRAFAQFEGVTVPGSPKCIARIHLYSDMWKYFDEGLYNFLVRYIYVPTLQIKQLQNKILASSLCFVFTYIWHGLQPQVLVWSSLNFIVILIEGISKHYYKSNVKLVSSLLSATWTRRLEAAVISPLLSVAIISNFYFFADVNIGNIFMNTLFLGTFKANFILLCMMYCVCQVSIEVKNWEMVKSKIKS